MFMAERDRWRHIWRENSIKADIYEAEERERRSDIDGEEHMQFLGEKLRKLKESRAKHEVEVRAMETKMNKTLEELMVDIVRLFTEESLDVLVWDLMGRFDKLREKGESLGEVLTLRMQDKKEVTGAIDKIRDTQKRTNMQGRHKDANN